MSKNWLINKLEKINNVKIQCSHCYINNKIKRILKQNLKKGSIKGKLSKHKPGCCTSFFNDKIHLWVLICDYHENRFVYTNLNNKSLKFVQKYAKRPHPMKKHKVKHYRNSHIDWKKQGYVIYGLDNDNNISIFKKQNLKSLKSLSRSSNPKYKKIIENLSYHFNKKQKRMAINKLVKTYPNFKIKDIKVNKIKPLLMQYSAN